MSRTRQPRPPRKPMKSCPHCGAANEPHRTVCVNCKKAMSQAIAKAIRRIVDAVEQHLRRGEAA